MFPTTHWSLLARASLAGESEARTALDELFRRYWSPLNQFIRWRGHEEAEAEDLTQEFLLHLLRHSTLERFERSRGRFRSFLLGALIRFLADQRKLRQAQKRGGSRPHLSLDTDGGELLPEAAEEDAAEVARFDRAWALTVFKAALAQVQAEYTAAGRASAFALLKRFLPGAAAPPPYETVAAELGCAVAALHTEVHRLRQRFKELVRAEVAATVSAPHETAEEMAHLGRVLMDRGTDFPANFESPG